MVNFVYWLRVTLDNSAVAYTVMVHCIRNAITQSKVVCGGDAFTRAAHESATKRQVMNI